MNLEIEIKFSPALASQAAQVFADPSVAPYLAGQETIRMHTRYFDTTDSALGRAGWSLRLRQENQKRLCTLKGPLAQGGRLEFSAEADTLEQGIAALLTQPLPDAEIKALLRSSPMEAVCGAVFTRTLTRYHRDGQAYDLCFDVGQLEKQGLAVGLSELEIELISGNQEELRRFAAALAAAYHLTEEQASKHSRAMALGQSSVGQEVNPYFIGSELLNYCVKKGYLLFSVGEDKRLHYTLTDVGQRVLTTEFDVNFNKSCAMPAGGADE